MNRGNVRLEPYVPRVVSEWDAVAPGRLWRTVAGSLVFVDISGFTALSERLAQKGRIGAEELTSVLNRVFGEMLDVVYQRGGSLLKFGGDALLLLFSTDDHLMQACAATVEMRSVLRQAAKQPTSVGRIDLRMSSGIHTGDLDLYLVGDSHRELIVTGPVASLTTEMEGTAEAGEIVVSRSVRDSLPDDFVGDRKGRGWLIRKRKIAYPACGPVMRDPDEDVDLSTMVSGGLREYLDAGIQDSEHRIATIAFVKFKGVDAMREKEGPEALGGHLELLVKTVQDAADGEGITFLASDVDADGGKIILAAGVPSSQHDDEGRVLRAARQILDSDPGLTVRIGVNRGHVFSGNVGTEFRRTYTVMGDTVNLAARLMAAAGPGMLYAAPEVLNLSSTLFRTQPLEPFHVKGKEQPVQAFSVFEETGVRPPVIESSLPFHGREAELEMLVGVVNTCSRVGRGGMMTISGDTGVGKSRLIAEVLERCSGMDVLMVQAEPGGVDNPYWAFRDPLRRLFGIQRGAQKTMAAELGKVVKATAPELSWATPLLGNVMHIEVPDNEKTAEIDPQFRPERTADALIELLSARHSLPVAMVAEDGQWLDEASLKLLDRIGTAAAEHPWTVLVTARSGSESNFAPLGSEIALPPLTDDAVRTITIEATQATPLRPHELDQIVGKADGNPLFLGEILRVVSQTGSADQLPDSLDAVISTEIDTLPPLARQLLRYSSVLGRRFRRVILDEFLMPEHVEVDDVTGQELGRFIEDEGEGRLAFRHSVVHDIAYSGLSYAKRRELHARAGDVIERRAGSDTEAVAEYLSTHYSQSGEYEKAWRYARVAATKAREAYANAEAAAHYQRAIDAARNIGEVDGSSLADMWISLGEVKELGGEMEESRRAYGHAARLVQGDPARLADIQLRRAGTWFNSGNLTQAKRNITIGRKMLGRQQGHLGALAQLDAFAATLHGASGDPVKADQTARAAIERAEESGNDEALARAYGVLDWANFMLGSGEPRRGPEAIGIYQRLGNLERAVGVMNNMGAFAYLEGNWDEAIRWYEESLEAANRSGNVLETALTRANIAEVLVGQRKYHEAAPLLDEARRIYEASNADYYMPLVGLLESRVKLGLGHVDEAVVQLERLLAGDETPWSTETVVALGMSLVQAGRNQEARELLKGRDETPSVIRVRAETHDPSKEPVKALEGLRAAVSAAENAHDLYEEATALEALHEATRRIGVDTDPANLARLRDLQARLGIVPSLVQL